MSINSSHYWRPEKPQNCKRSNTHNYKSPATYLITIGKERQAPDFATLSGDPYDLGDPPLIILSEVGSIINTQLREMSQEAPLKLLGYMIMPDHLHILWQAESWLPKELDFYVGMLKSRCATAWHKLLGIAPDDPLSPPLFTHKYGDCIATDAEASQRLLSYISDNPRLRLTMQQHPELFTRRQRVKIGDRVLDVYGNFLLLRHPVISAVIVSSKYTPEQLQQHQQQWRETIRNAGVLVSPFFSHDEKDLLYKGIEEGASIIRVLPEGLPQEYKPSGAELKLAMQGRCLHIGATPEAKRPERISRSTALQLNALARWIASHPRERMSIIR